MKRYGSWAIIVSLNAIVGFFIGGSESDTIAQWAGMILGVATWFCIYVYVDGLFIAAGLTHLSKKLKLSAILRIPIQLTVYPDMWAIFLATFTLDWLNILQDGSGFLVYYFQTVLTGLYLSVICALIFLILSIFIRSSDE